MTTTQTIVTPTEIDRPLYEGQMTVTPAALSSKPLLEKGGERIRHTPGLAGPVVTLGQPQWWNLADLAGQSGSGPRGASTDKATQHSHRIRLLGLLGDHFDEGELRTLCFSLNVDYDSLPAQGKVNKARELIAFLERHNRLSDLFTTGQQLRPDVPWTESLEPAKSSSPTLDALTGDADFYLLRLACSFRPERGSQIKWARFTAHLHPQAGQERPIAFDLYPYEIDRETLTDVQVGISPGLQFVADPGQLAQMDELIATVVFKKLEPVIVGYGAQESSPNWDFESHSLRGSKFGYLVVKKPRQAQAVRLELDVVVDVLTQDGSLSAHVPDGDRTGLSQVICTD